MRDTLVRASLWAACLSAAVCAACKTPPPEPATQAPSPGVAILSSERCPVPESAEGSYAAMRQHAGGHSHAGAPGAGAPAGPSIEERFPADEIDQLRRSAEEGRCLKIRYRSDGLSVVGFILKPPAPRGPSPAVIVARGGNRDLGKIGAVMLLDLNKLAAEGFVIVATQYRGADGGEGADEFGGADLADLEGLIPLARAMPEVDAENLFLLG